MTLRKNIAKLSKLEHDKYVRLSNVFQFFVALYILVQVYYTYIYTYLYIQFKLKKDPAIQLRSTRSSRLRTALRAGVRDTCA